MSLIVPAPFPPAAMAAVALPLPGSDSVVEQGLDYLDAGGLAGGVEGRLARHVPLVEVEGGGVVQGP